jgi:NAD(P)-dependent dehydrogenase (short-subunit alcohol dehydrogenase family)
MTLNTKNLILCHTGPAEYFPIELYQRQMDVNFLGYVRVTQAFLPLLKKFVNSSVLRARRAFVMTCDHVLVCV